jgi:hypothetical protein
LFVACLVGTTLCACVVECQGWEPMGFVKDHLRGRMTQHTHC